MENMVKINKRKKEWKEKTADQKYAYQVEENIEYYFKMKMQNYIDPDNVSERFVNVIPRIQIQDYENRQMTIRIKTDGLYGYRRIEAVTNEPFLH